MQILDLKCAILSRCAYESRNIKMMNSEVTNNLSKFFYIPYQRRILGGLWGPRPPGVTKGAPKRRKGKGKKEREERKKEEKKGKKKEKRKERGTRKEKR